MIKLCFERGRTSFKYGLRSLNLSFGNKILIPDYLCDVLVDIIYEENLIPVFYKINNDFSINRRQLKNLYKNHHNIKAILIVNYFGIDNKLNKIIEFAKKRNIFTITDDCHKIDRAILKKDTIATDIYFTAPYKLFNNFYGGSILILKKNYNKNLINNLNRIPFEKFRIYKFFNYFFTNYLFFLKKLIKNIFFSKPDYFSFNKINNPSIQHTRVKKINFLKINRFFIKKKKIELNNLKIWINFLKSKNYKFKIINTYKESNHLLWVLAINLPDLKQRSKILKFGLNNNFNIFPWPTLHKKVINKKLKKKWYKLICIDLKDKPPN